MPGRMFSSNSYRYGFNGKEKDDEINNIEGAYDDFGARMYDSRLGRWFSRDVAEPIFASSSPYNFVNNNPVRYLDINGLFPGDCNLMIIIGHYDKPQLPTKEGDWTVIKANSMEEALLYMEVASIKKGSIDNLAIETHGGGQDSPLPIGGFMTADGGGTGVISTNVFQYDVNKIPFINRPKENVNNLDAFGKVLDYLNDNPSILVGACGGGREDKFNLLLYNYIESHVKSFDLYLSTSDVNYKVTYDEKDASKKKEDRKFNLEPTFDQKLILEEDLFYGGFQKYSTKEEDPNQYNVTIDKNNSIFSGEFKLTKISDSKSHRKTKTISPKSEPKFK